MKPNYEVVNDCWNNHKFKKNKQNIFLFNGYSVILKNDTTKRTKFIL